MLLQGPSSSPTFTSMTDPTDTTAAARCLHCGDPTAGLPGFCDNCEQHRAALEDPALAAQLFNQPADLVKADRVAALHQLEEENTDLRQRLADVQAERMKEAEAINETNQLLLQLMEEKTETHRRLLTYARLHQRCSDVSQTARSTLREVAALAAMRTDNPKYPPARLKAFTRMVDLLKAAESNLHL